MLLQMDPDSEAMGIWVDRWLHSLRARGAHGRELAQAARRLASAMHPCHSAAADEALAAFLYFVQGQSRT